MIGKTISHYKILEKLGEGGMGVVYKAEDTKLKRPVALKFLPSNLTQDQEAKKRFIQEAQSASALQHNNICKIHEINETDDGQIYISMEYYAGKTLKEKIGEDTLTFEEAIDIVTQVARGLEKAHKKGIVHRDIKPANIIVTDDGVAKILDFGLAKLAGQTKLTKTGSTLGTVAYMSPEQTQGTDVDQRTDIWALGVILYELLSGEHPFKGDYEQAVMFSILNEEPKPITDLRPEIPKTIEQVVAKAIEKNPDERYQQVGELLDDLISISAGIVPDEIKVRMRKAKLRKRKRIFLYAGASGLIIIMAVIALSLFTGRAEAIESIAVLPLENLTGDDEKEYFVEAATDELIGQLGQISGFKRVISRTSVMQYKETDKSLPEIARELNVDALVEGSVYQVGEKVRIRVQLIDALPEERNLWVQTYERPMADVLMMYSEMAYTIADTTRIVLTAEEMIRLNSAHPVNPEAHDAYLKGSYHWKKTTPEDLDIAQRYFELALEKDPSYAPAYAGLAWVWAVRQQRLITLPRETGPKAKAAALQAVALDDRSATAHAALAGIMTWTEWDWAGAELEWRRALELDPNAANTHAYFAHFLVIAGRLKDALLHSEKALELDPFNALFQALFSKVLLFDRRYDDALAAARTALVMQPGNVSARRQLRDALFCKGMSDEHLAYQREWFADDPELATALERGVAEAGYEGAQKRIANILAARYEESAGVPDPGGLENRDARLISKRYLSAGDYDKAIDWLENAYEVHHPSLPYIGFHPIYDPLRSDPRFQDLLRKMNLPVEK